MIKESKNNPLFSQDKDLERLIIYLMGELNTVLDPNVFSSPLGNIDQILTIGTLREAYGTKDGLTYTLYSDIKPLIFDIISSKPIIDTYGYDLILSALGFNRGVDTSKVMVELINHVYDDLGHRLDGASVVAMYNRELSINATEQMCYFIEQICLFIENKISSYMRDVLRVVEAQIAHKLKNTDALEGADKLKYEVTLLPDIRGIHYNNIVHPHHLTLIDLWLAGVDVDGETLNALQELGVELERN